MVVFTQKLNPTEGEVDAVLAALIASEQMASYEAGYLPFGILLSDEDGGPVTGGLYGYRIFDWLFIQYVAVPNRLQGKGIGRELMARAEAWSREHNLAGMWLDTFAFQARPFYEKLGFSVFGTIEDHPRGSRRFFMHKRL